MEIVTTILALALLAGAIWLTQARSREEMYTRIAVWALANRAAAQTRREKRVELAVAYGLSGKGAA